MAKCQRCDGCGKIADTEKGEAWTAWTHEPSSASVLLGIVKPVKCPDCGGTGEQKAR